MLSQNMFCICIAFTSNTFMWFRIKPMPILGSFFRFFNYLQIYFTLILVFNNSNLGNILFPVPDISVLPLESDAWLEFF